MRHTNTTISRNIHCVPLLSSANEVWVEHRNAGHPSVLSSGRPSIRPTCERDKLKNHFIIQLQI